MNTTSTTALATEPPVWFITGCSTGFGLDLANQAIARGHRAVATARDPSKREGFGATDQVLVLPRDVTKPDDVAAAIKATEARFGRIKVLVNNAGIGYLAAGEVVVWAADFPKSKADAQA